MSGSSDYTTTPNLGLYKPTVNADDSAWGDHLNLNADILDTHASTLEGSFLPITGGEMTGPLNYTATGGTVSRSAQDRASDIIFAKDYGGIWDGTHDVAPAINAALTTAVAAGGGIVVLPPGNYPIASQLTINTSGVGLRGAGTDAPNDNAINVRMLASTTLTWTGAAGGTMLRIAPLTDVSLYGCDITGICFEGASLADICCQIVQLSYSKIEIGVSEPRMFGALFTTAVMSDPAGTQYNEIWVTSRSTSATYAPTGICFDRAVGSLWNCSGNIIRVLRAYYAKGDGIVFGSADANHIEWMSADPHPVNKGGTPLVFANTAYVMKNGLAVHGEATSMRVLKAQSSGIVCGLQSGTTIVPGVHAGTAAVAAVTLTTNAITPLNQGLLNFASTTGVVAGMVANAPNGWASGVGPNVAIVQVLATTAGMSFGAVNQVASGVPVTFSFGITTQAVSGTYTLTAVDGTHWNVTAPGGGHSQSNIPVSGGVLTLTDMVVPLSGTPVAGDTFVVTVPAAAAVSIQLEQIDDGNAAPNFIIEPGAVAFTTRTNIPFLRPYGNGSKGNITLTPDREGVLQVNGAANVTGVLTVNAVTTVNGVERWGGYANARCLVVQATAAALHPAIGFPDFTGANWRAIANDSGNIDFLAMPAPGDTTTSPGLMARLSATQNISYVPFLFQGAVGFNNTAPIAKPTVTGSKGANAALASLLTALAAYGLVTDSST